jgi:hypothetical protein
VTTDDVVTSAGAAWYTATGCVIRAPYKTELM